MLFLSPSLKMLGDYLQTENNRFLSEIYFIIHYANFRIKGNKIRFTSRSPFSLGSFCPPNLKIRIRINSSIIRRP